MKSKKHLINGLVIIVVVTLLIWGIWVYSRSDMDLSTLLTVLVIVVLSVAILGIIIGVIAFRIRTGKTKLFVGIFVGAIPVAIVGWCLLMIFGPILSLSDHFKEFDETEFLKTHYQGVDCSSLVGSVTFGDYGIPAQAACIGERAWYESNIELCNHINGCMAWIAVKTGDLEICKQLKPERAPSMEDKLIRDKQQNVSQYGCEQSVAIYRDMPAICDLIPYSNEHYMQECKEKATDGETYLQFKASPMRPYCVEYNSNGKCVW